MKTLRNWAFVAFFLVLGQALAQDDLKLSERILPIGPEHIFKTEGYFNWCGSVVKGADGRYHLFYSRWPEATKFTGWLLFSEVARAVSDSATGPWDYQETVLTGRGPGYWDAITAHNPKIRYYEGKYYLYYISTRLDGDPDFSDQDLWEISKTSRTHPLWKSDLRPNQRSGVAVAESLDGPWVRQDQPLIEPGGPITTLTVNPAITQGKDGRYYLIVKGDKPNVTGFVRNQAMAISERPDGDFVIQPKPVIDYLDTEDMSLWYDEARGYYYGIFHSTEHFIGLVSSPDGINWSKAGEFKLMDKAIAMRDGSWLKPQRLERPFVYEENGAVRMIGFAVKEDEESYVVCLPLKPEN
ncbi:glycoside hydrolase family protein [Algoriphagus sp. H41]|uniref:Glycoside hydrolase family protein n=1 Tax=Algoriphagus oliviformis TaxID=2811231 RepID=A0ABS3C2P9_9BACT|nr:glycoside hydrolase family protein [Algoriphagus oliviformis]MBN7811217.1 glycoside hydrolase family protein [Algoriphagus oliviformis]